jgi:hypothetical protein
MFRIAGVLALPSGARTRLRPEAMRSTQRLPCQRFAATQRRSQFELWLLHASFRSLETFLSSLWLGRADFPALPNYAVQQQLTFIFPTTSSRAPVQRFEVDNLAGAISFITTTGSIALLPVYAKNLFSGLITSRPLKGEPPTIDLCISYKKADDSPILKVLLSRVDELIARVSSKLQDRKFRSTKG